MVGVMCVDRSDSTWQQFHGDLASIADVFEYLIERENLGSRQTHFSFISPDRSPLRLDSTVGEVMMQYRSHDRSMAPHSTWTQRPPFSLPTTSRPSRSQYGSRGALSHWSKAKHWAK